MDPNRGAAPPHDPSRGARRPGSRARRLVPLFGAPKWRPSTNREMGGGGAPVLGGRHSKGTRNNQPNDGFDVGGGIGEAIRTVRTRGGGYLLVVSGDEMSN